MKNKVAKYENLIYFKALTVSAGHSVLYPKQLHTLPEIKAVWVILMLYLA